MLVISLAFAFEEPKEDCLHWYYKAKQAGTDFSVESQEFKTIMENKHLVTVLKRKEWSLEEICSEFKTQEDFDKGLRLYAKEVKELKKYYKLLWPDKTPQS